MSTIEDRLKAKYENLSDQIIHTPCDLPENDPDYYVVIEGAKNIRKKKTGKGKRYETKETKFFPNKNISSKTLVVEKELSDGRTVIDVQLQEQGMSKDNLIAHFPPRNKSGTRLFNRLAILRAILMEEYLKVGKNREEGNVRRIWYTNFLYTLTRVLGDTHNQDSINTSISTCWKEMIESGLVNYDGLNIVGGKENLWESYTLHSPYAYIFDFIEKSDYLKPFRWFIKLFGIQIVAPSGQPSRASAFSMVRNLMLQRVDLTQTFYALIISDLDPEGLAIQDAMIHHLRLALKHYSGIRNPRVKKIRLFLKKDQVSAEMVKHFGIPYVHMEAKKESAIKSAKTKYKNFAKSIGGGIYDKDGSPLKIELNAISESVMQKRIVEELLKIIDDKSLIMIPEIMRELNNQREKVVSLLFTEYAKKFIKPESNKYLFPLFGLRSDIEVKIVDIQEKLKNTYDKSKEKVIDEYRDLLGELSILYSIIIKKIKSEVYKQTKDLSQLISTKEFEKLQLQQEIDHLKVTILDRTPSQQEWLKFLPKQEEIENKHLENQRKEKIKPIEEKYRENKDKLWDKWGKYKEELKNFEEKLLLKFNPVEIELEEQVKHKTSEEKELIIFEELEQNESVLKELKYLLSSPDLAGKTPIKERPSPVFLNEHSLDNATQYCLKTLGKTDHIPVTTIRKFRDGFTPALKTALYEFVHTHLKKVHIKPPTIPDLPDYSDKMNKLRKKLDKQISDEFEETKQKSTP